MTQGALRVLLFGGTGMLGTDLRAGAPASVSITAPDAAEVDISNPADVSRAYAAVRPAVVINAAAYTLVDDAEIDTAQADAINRDGPRLLGEAAAQHGARIVHFGTDYVFPGTSTRPYREDDPVAPLNAYGRGKLEGERALLGSHANALILRTQWLFGRAGKSFPRTMWSRATSRQRTRVVADQFGRPTYTVDLAAMTWKLVDSDARGVLHAANGGEVASWHDVASAVFARAGARELLAPCDTVDYPTPAARPRYSALDITRLTRILGSTPPDWRDALDRFLDEIDGPARGAATEP